MHSVVADKHDASTDTVIEYSKSDLRLDNGAFSRCSLYSKLSSWSWRQLRCLPNNDVVVISFTCNTSSPMSSSPSPVTYSAASSPPQAPVVGPPTPSGKSSWLMVNNSLHINVTQLGTSQNARTTITASSTINTPTLTVILHGREVLSFTSKDVPDPPALRLANADMSPLIRCWYDASVEWDPSGYTWTHHGNQVLASHLYLWPKMEEYSCYL